MVGLLLQQRAGNSHITGVCRFISFNSLGTHRGPWDHDPLEVRSITCQCATNESGIRRRTVRTLLCFTSVASLHPRSMANGMQVTLGAYECV